MVRALSRSTPWLLALAWPAGGTAHAQFSSAPVSQPRSAALPSEALNEKAYRRDAGRHFYSAYSSQVMYGVLPPLLYAVMVTETQVDANGKVLNVRVRRAAGRAREVTPWVVGMIRRAAHSAAASAHGQGDIHRIWLVDRSGRLQVDSLTEGQR